MNLRVVMVHYCYLYRVVMVQARTVKKHYKCHRWFENSV